MSKRYLSDNLYVIALVALCYVRTHCSNCGRLSGHSTADRMSGAVKS